MKKFLKNSCRRCLAMCLAMGVMFTSSMSASAITCGDDICNSETFKIGDYVVYAEDGEYFTTISKNFPLYNCTDLRGVR